MRSIKALARQNSPGARMDNSDMARKWISFDESVSQPMGESDFEDGRHRQFQAGFESWQFRRSYGMHQHMLAFGVVCLYATSLSLFGYRGLPESTT